MRYELISNIINFNFLFFHSDESLEKYLNDEDSVVLIDRFISRLEVVSLLKLVLEQILSFTISRYSFTITVGWVPG